MNKFITILAMLAIVLGCKNNQAKVDDSLNPEFVKNGTLDFINDGKVVKTIDIELADSPSERQMGLQHRQDMKENQGMLFVFEDSEIMPHRFHMKNCKFPIDIIYLGSDSTVINIAKNAAPGKTERDIEGARGPSKFVVEINAGLSDQWNIKDSLTKINFNIK